MKSFLDLILTGEMIIVKTTEKTVTVLYNLYTSFFLTKWHTSIQTVQT